MTLLQSARPGTNTDETISQSMERVPQEVVDPEGSVGSSGDREINVYCEDKLRSLSEGEIQTLVDVSGESIANMWSGPIVIERVVDESIHVDVVGDSEDGGREYLSSTPVKSAGGVRNVADSSKLPSESPVKRPAGVAFMISEDGELMCEVAQSGKRKKSNDGDVRRIATSTGGLTIEIGLSEIDDMIGQGPSTSHFNDPLFGGTSVGSEMPPREELIAHENFSTKREYYPDQSATTLLEDFFVLNPPTLLDPGHTTTSLSADQMIQFSRAVGLEVTLASKGPLEDLLVRSRGVGALSSRGVP